MAYSTDGDLLEIRPNILDLGRPEWTSKHAQAAEIINRRLIREWYKSASAENGVDFTETEFDSTKVKAGELTLLSCYKTLELIYMVLMKDTPEPDGFEREMGLFRKLYNEEFKEILSVGVNYDWDADDVIASDEKYVLPKRRLLRM